MHKVKIHRATTDPLQNSAGGPNIRISPPGRYKKWAAQQREAGGPEGDPYSWSKEAYKEAKDIYKAAKNQGIPTSENTGQGGGWSSSKQAGLQMAAGAIGGVSKAFTSMNDTTSQASLGIRDSISDAAINSGNPYAMAIGAAAKVVDAIGDATGFHVDDIDKDAAKEAGVSGGVTFLNNAMNALPGNSLLMAAFSPNKTIDAANLDDYGNDVLAGYSGVESTQKNAEKLAGKRTLFGIGRKKMNDYISESNRQVNLINQIGYTNSLVKNSDYSKDLAQQNLSRYAGTTYNMNAVGKNGMKILSRKELQAILATKKLQKGGVIGTDTNILPEGALHARLNHLQQEGSDLEDATRKGIPVLDAEGNQVAEIERDEIVLRLEVTKKIEELMKDGSEEAMIEAGKLLVDEIIDNTQDNTGQITEEIENGK